MFKFRDKRSIMNYLLIYVLFKNLSLLDLNIYDYEKRYDSSLRRLIKDFLEPPFVFYSSKFFGVNSIIIHVLDSFILQSLYCKKKSLIADSEIDIILIKRYPVRIKFK